jgi:type VI secretion system protein ImpA
VSAIDLKPLLAEVSPDAPSGEKDDKTKSDIAELEIKLKETRERLVGENDEEETGPNWPEIRDDTFNLLTRNHDLRVAMFFTRAMLHTAELKGLKMGLELLCGLIERYWENLYPQLEPDDNNDPTERINILMALTEGQDIIDPLPKTTLVEARGVGRFSLRDIHIANGKIKLVKNVESALPTTELINAAFKACDLEEMKATRTVIGESLQYVETLSNLLNEKINEPTKEKEDDSPEDKKRQPYSIPDFKELKEILKEMEAVMAKQLEIRGDSDASEKGETSETEGSSNAQAGESVSTQGGKPMDKINTRQDVIRALDKICTYYQNNEPGSPVPLLLKRARQLVEKNFFEIMQDLGLDSAAQIKTLFNGAADDKS